MKKRITFFKIAVLQLILMGLICISACDAGLEIVDLKIVSYPDKIIYIKDVDTHLSVEGLELQSVTRDGTISSVSPSVLHGAGDKIDFSKEGVQIVKIDLGYGLSAEFPIQIVSKEWLESTLKEVS